MSIETFKIQQAKYTALNNQLTDLNQKAVGINANITSAKEQVQQLLIQCERDFGVKSLEELKQKIIESLAENEETLRLMSSEAERLKTETDAASEALKK